MDVNGPQLKKLAQDATVGSRLKVMIKKDTTQVGITGDIIQDWTTFRDETHNFKGFREKCKKERNNLYGMIGFENLSRLLLKLFVYI